MPRRLTSAPRSHYAPPAPPLPPRSGAPPNPARPPPPVSPPPPSGSAGRSGPVRSAKLEDLAGALQLCGRALRIAGAGMAGIAIRRALAGLLKRQLQADEIVAAWRHTRCRLARVADLALAARHA